MAKVPATSRSGMIHCETPRSLGTPSISTIGVPSPAILAPMSISIRPSSTTSGSQDALMIVVRP
jgi:hypothetical protein